MKPFYKVLAATAITGGLASAAIISHKLTKFMMELAMDREKPQTKNPEKARQHIRGGSYLEKFLEDIEIAGGELKAQETEEITLTAQDGVSLVGHLRTCEHPKRLILAMHGWRSTWYEDFGMISDFWNQNGCMVLYAEQRGQNNSGGDYMGFGLLERFDCQDWANYLNERFPDVPLYLAGVSMGAATVMMAAGLDLPSNVKGIAADCGYTSAYAIWKHVVNNNLHIPYGLHSAAVEDLCRKKIQVGPRECTTTEALQKSKLPLLLIHGTDDSFVPVEMTYENYKAAQGPKKLLIVPGADHGMSYYLAKDEYEKTALDFWNTCEQGEKL